MNRLYLFGILLAFILTTSRGIVHMKTYPSDNTLNDLSKRNIIVRMLNDVQMDLTSYMTILNNSIIKEKQVLTTTGMNILMLPEHRSLLQQLKRKYPDRFMNGTYLSSHRIEIHFIGNNIINNHRIIFFFLILETLISNNINDLSISTVHHMDTHLTTDQSTNGQHSGIYSFISQYL